MKGLLKIFLFVLIGICFSCEERGWIADCAECVANEPREGFLSIRLTGNELPVRVRVYQGEIEDSVLYAYTEIYGGKYTPGITLNKKYTVTATYNIGGSIYIAIDSATPKVRYIEDQCEESCYFVYDRVIDLRLKYTAD
jgi:hypothetical protein